MGGALEAESEPGVGSLFRFSIEVPLESEPAAVAPAPDVRGGDAPRTSDALRILVAEDNAVNQLVMRHLLGKMGHEADVVSDGAEAVEAALRRPYDVVLMDVQMPVMDGVAATRRIAERLGERRPRVIAVTAHAMRGDRERYLEAGMDDYVSKPVAREALQAALARCPQPTPPGQAGTDRPPLPRGEASAPTSTSEPAS